MENVEQSQIDFVINASEKEKEIGHNKYQTAIVELSTKLEELNKVLDETEKSKKSIQDENDRLKLQLQDVTAQHNDTTKTSEDISNELLIANKHLTLNNVKYNDLVQSKLEMKKEYTTTNNELMTQIKELQEENESNIKKYNELKQQYQSNLNNLDNKSTQNHSSEEEIKTLTDKLKLSSALNRTTANDIFTIRQQVSDYENVIATLHDTISEKDNIIADYTRGLNVRPANIKVGGRPVQPDASSINVYKTHVSRAPLSRTMR